MTKKAVIQTLLCALAFLFMFGCATKQPVPLPPFSPQSFDADQYESKVDNFVLILDASSSMRHDYMGNTKFNRAKAIMERLNLTLPELGQTAGLRSFGHHPSVSSELTTLFYGMKPYQTAGMADALGDVFRPGGFSPLANALNAVQTDLAPLDGVHNAVVIVSDGKDMQDAQAQAQALIDRYGSSLCIYTVLVGDCPSGRRLLEEIANISGCGFATSDEALMDPVGMADFVEKVFLKEKPAPEPAPAPAPVRKDSDGDGVYDDEDQCPGTPAGARVNAVGCWVLDNVLFDFDKSVIKPEGYPLLDEVVAIMEKNPTMGVELQGHTDNIGTKEYNMGLSKRRANAVAEYLVSKGIPRNRLATTWFGFSKPVALNGTKFGRSLNRRVELHPY